MSAEDVRKLHSKFGLYNECDCYRLWKGKAAEEIPDNSEPEHHDGKEPIHIEDIGYTCAEPQWICRECSTDDGEVHEYSDEGEWPCRTLKALEKAEEIDDLREELTRSEGEEVPVPDVRRGEARGSEVAQG